MLKASSNQSKAMTWAVCAVALGKAAIAGAGVGLSVLGITITVDNLVPLVGDFFSQEQVLSYAAIGGGVLGIAAEILFRS